MKAEARSIRLKQRFEDRMQVSLQRRLLSVDECQAVTGLSSWWWRRAAYAGRVESVKISNRLLIPVEAVDRIIAENTRPRVGSASAA